MASDGISPALAVRSSAGLEQWCASGVKGSYIVHPQFSRDECKFCRAVAYSPDGRFLAWNSDPGVNIMSTATNKVLLTVPRPKTLYLKFSPNGNYLVTWESFYTTKEDPEGTPNLRVYNTTTGAEVYSTVQKKNSCWEPSWSSDETIFAVMLGGEAFFYDTKSESGFNKPAKKIGGARNGLVSVAPNAQQPFVAFYTPGTKGGPSMCKIYKYPDLQANQPVGCKSFYQADSVELLWNKRGTGLLLLTSTDVDKTGASYYGNQALHFMNTNGDSFAVQLSKEGSVHAVEWNPNSSEFCVVFGFMPSKTTFFNLKCDPVFEVDEGEKNSIYYNTFGNMVILAGFGNLNGGLEVWDVAKKKMISKMRAPDTTAVEWSPNGELFVTATTAPRLKVGNCFKVWHYSGALLHETIWTTGQELYDVIWQRFPVGVFTAKPITTNHKIEGIKSSQPMASSEPYRPPGARGIEIPPITSPAAAKPTKKKQNASRVEYNQKRLSAFLRTKGVELGGAADGTTNGAETNGTNGAVTAAAGGGGGAPHPSKKPPLTPEELEKVKRIKTVNKKLSDISKLKTRKEKGEHLEVNQLAKITSEADLLKELKELKVAS